MAIILAVNLIKKSAFKRGFTGFTGFIFTAAYANPESFLSGQGFSQRT